MLALRRRSPFQQEGMWPFERLTNLHHEMDRVFGHLWGETPGMGKVMKNGHGFAPAAEVTSDENAWHVRMALPGVDPKDVPVEVTDNMLTVTGERTMEEEKTGENRQTEFSYGRFERSFMLPKIVNVDGVTAGFENGMLELMLPMMEAAKPRKIEVKEAGSSRRRRRDSSRAPPHRVPADGPCPRGTGSLCRTAPRSNPDHPTAVRKACGEKGKVDA